MGLSRPISQQARPDAFTYPWTVSAVPAAVRTLCKWEGNCGDSPVNPGVQAACRGPATGRGQRGLLQVRDYVIPVPACWCGSRFSFQGLPCLLLGSRVLHICLSYRTLYTHLRQLLLFPFPVVFDLCLPHLLHTVPGFLSPCAIHG